MNRRDQLYKWISLRSENDDEDERAVQTGGQVRHEEGQEGVDDSGLQLEAAAEESF